jgi:hypothetical protein
MLLRKWLPLVAIVLIFLATWQLALQKKSVQVTDLDLGQKETKSNHYLNSTSKSESVIHDGRPTSTTSTASVERPVGININDDNDSNSNNTTGLEVSSKIVHDSSHHPSSSSAQTGLNWTESATIVVQLSGEMANNLQHIAHGVGLQLWLKEQFDIPSNVILRHFVGPNNRAPKPKWKSARNDILQCFPSLKNWDFTAGNSKEFTQRQSQQKTWLGERTDRMFGMINGQTSAEIESGLVLLKGILKHPSSSKPVVEDDATIRLPYLYSESLDVYPLLDRYYENFRQLFQIDPACCAQRPLPDESVFHFRNFQSELPGTRAHDMGFDELSPNKTAHELFVASTTTNITTGVAITTRIHNAASRAYVQALQNRGIPARLVTDQTGPQDFCFLASTQKELVANARSTFGTWAGLIGNSTSLRWYHVDNYGLRNRHADFRQRFSYNWTHPELQRRVRFEWYQSEELEDTPP